MFWQDKWLDGRSIKDMAPHLYALVPKRRENRRIFLEALSNEQWLEDIQRDISVAALFEYLTIWDILEEIELRQDTPDKHIWRLSPIGAYTVSSAYDALYQGALCSAHMNEFGNLGRRLNVVFSCG
jgi:hypothetical protein